MDATHLAGLACSVPDPGKKGEGRPPPETSNLLFFVQEGNALLHKSFFFLFSLINPWWLRRGQADPPADLGWKKLPAFQSALREGGWRSAAESFGEGGRLLTWLMKLYLNLEDLGLQRHFSPTRGIPDEGRLLFVPNSQAQVVRKLTPL